MPGELDAAYVRARGVLLDALEALQDQLPALVLVGAQAIYLHTGEGDLAVLPYTTDADIALDPSALSADPALDAAMSGAGFLPHPTDVGIWTRGGSQVDLLVPAAIGGSGRRAARLASGHGKRTAMKVTGLEAALVDRAPMVIEALLPDDDPRRFELMVAGPAALLVAKLYKLSERRREPHREDDKDALDVYRLLSSTGTGEMAARVRMLQADDLAGEVTEHAITFLRELFEAAAAPGSAMAGRSVEGVSDPAFVAAAASALANDLLDALTGSARSDTIDDVLDAAAIERLAEALADAGNSLRSRIDNLDGAKAAIKGAGEALERAAAELREAAKPTD